jgi:hypothetical protein
MLVYKFMITDVLFLIPQAYARHQYGRWAWRTASMQGNPVHSGASSSSSSASGALPQQPEWRAPRIAIVDIDVHHGASQLSCGTNAFAAPNRNPPR